MSADLRDLDAAVRKALADDAAWRAAAVPSEIGYRPQVGVRMEGGTNSVFRRPFKQRGVWKVRWAGVARLTGPQEIDGLIIFNADYS